MRSVRAGMKLPVEVRASEGKKYCSPDAGPATFHRRGSCPCRRVMARAKTPATAAQVNPTMIPMNSGILRRLGRFLMVLKRFNSSRAMRSLRERFC